MTYILFIFAVVLGLAFKRSRICTVYILTVMIILAAFNYQSADIANYRMEYAQAIDANVDSLRYVGYSYLIKLSANAGLSWEQYRVIFYAVTFVLLSVAIRILTKNVNLVLAIYLITYYGIDVIQMKSHIADVLAFFGIAFIVKCLSEGKPLKNWRTVFSVFLLLLSALMHFATAFYVLAFVMFVLLYRHKDMTKKIIIMLLVILAAIYGNVLSIIVHYANQLGILGDLNYLEGWLHVATRYGYLIQVAFVVSAVLSCNLFRYAGEEDNSLDSRSEIDLLLSRFLITALMLIPLFVINTTYDRLMRVYILIALCCYANEKIKVNMSRVRFLSLVFEVVTIMFAFYVGTYSFYSTTLGSIFKYNSIL